MKHAAPEASAAAPDHGGRRRSATATNSAPEPTSSSLVPGAALNGGVLRDRTIVIDPGHTGAWTSAWGYRKVPDGAGGRKACNSSGTASRGGYSEHAYNLAQAQALATVLRSRGATVKLTRTDDHTRSDALCVNHRADLANRLDADAFVSIHADGNTNASHRGFHIIVSTAMHGGSRVAAASKRLAAGIRSAMASTGMPHSNYIGGGTAYSFRSDLGTLNFAERPAVMLEMGNMRNPTDAKLFASAAFRERAAEALADGITTFLTS